MELKITANNFEAEVINSEVPVLVDFYADWCGPCKMMSPVLSVLAQNFDGKIKVGKCNVDEESQLAARFKVMSIPNMIIFKKGQVVKQIVGAVPQSQLEAAFEEVLH